MADPETKFDIPQMDPKDQATLVKAVALGKEKTHALSALLAVAKYRTAKDNAEDLSDETGIEVPWSFETQLMGEVDGTNNGAMITHLALGAGVKTFDGSAVENLMDRLNQGGFFGAGSVHTQYNLWRAANGNFDLYETTAKNIIARADDFAKFGIFDKDVELVSAKNMGLALDSIFEFTGLLEDVNGEINSTGRNITKTPVLALVFGSSTKKGVEGMSEDFITAIYKKIAKTDLTDAGTKEDLITKINFVMSQGKQGKGWTKIPDGATSKQLMGNEKKGGIRVPLFTEAQLVALKTGFANTLGVAVQESLEADFEPLINQRREVNTGAQLAYDLYASIENAAIAKFMKDAMEASLHPESTDAKIPFRMLKGKRVPLHDINQKQLADIRKDLAPFAPFIATYSSKQKEGTPIDQGIWIPKRETKNTG